MRDEIHDVVNGNGVERIVSRSHDKQVRFGSKSSKVLHTVR